MIRVLNHCHHTPHNYMLARALPDIQWTFKYWNNKQRPLPDNVTLSFTPDPAGYDAFIFTEPWYDYRMVKAARYVHVRHIEADPNDVVTQQRMSQLASEVDSFVVVSDHKRSQLACKDAPSMVTIGFGIDTERMLPAATLGYSIGSLHNNAVTPPCISKFVNLIGRQLPFILIGLDNWPLDCCTIVEPPSYLHLIRSMQQLGVFVHVVCGNTFGFSPLEAMACGLPVIAGKNADTPAWVRKSPGYIEMPASTLESVDEIAKEVRMLLKFPAHASLGGKANREAIMANATLAHIAPAWRTAILG